MVSMRDVAIACGVSVATVSKAINNHSDISEETKAMIRKKAKDMGYFPNSSARALKTNRSYNLGVLFVDQGRSGLTHDYFAAVLDAFKVTAESKGYDITFINCSKTRKERMSYLEHSRYRGLDGVVIACVDFYDPEVVELVNSDIPVVTIDHVFNDRICVTSDNIGGMQDIVRYVAGKGHRKIAYVHGDDTAVTRARLTSFYKTMEECGLPINDDYVIESKYRDTKLAAEITNRLLDSKNPPTCILYCDDFSAIGGLNAMKARGLHVGEDISIAGYDDIVLAAQLEPRLTTIHQDTCKMGSAAAECLINMIEKPKTTLIEQVVVPGWLIEGASVGNV